jgi:hypothetical protein
LKGTRTRIVLLSKKQGVARRTTSQCNRKALEQAKGIVASNKE